MTKPDQWTLSPQMTAAPGLWRNIAFCAPLWEGNGFATDLVSRQAADNKGGGQYIQGTEGTAFEVSADGHGFYWPVLPTKLDLSDLSTGDYFSVLILVNITQASTGAFDRMIEISDSSSGNSRWNIYFDDDEAGSGEFVVWSNDYGVNVGEIEWYDAFPGVGLHSFIVTVRYGSGTDSDSELFINGVSQGSPSESGADWSVGANADAVMSITDPKDGIDNVMQGDYYMVALWKNRRILAHEAKLLWNDPFIMLRPAGF